MKTKIYAVQEVTLTISGAAMVTVIAKGTVRTGGWTEPELKPSEQSFEDSGGPDVETVHLDFVATKPTGIVTQAITPIAAQRSYPAPASGKTLRVVVHVETNEKDDSIKSPLDPR
jgi:small ligand-binding sensory domain FIST